MSNKNKILIVIAIIVIGIICIVCFDKSKETSGNTITNEEKKEKVNTQIGDVIDSIVNDNKENNEVENKTENTENENTQETSTETFEESPKTEEEKAIEIVKKDYNQEEGIKYNIEGMDENGRQIVVVRDSKTTEALVFYFVNVSDETFTKKEMN